MNTWGIPDWRDEAAYPDSKTTSPTRWAWEFLRRNPGYRKDWARYIERATEAAGKDPALRDLVEAMQDATADAWKVFREKYSRPGKAGPGEWCDLALKLEDAEAMFEYAPPRLPGESKREHVKRCGRVTCVPLAVALARKWGLEGIEPPHLSKPWGAWRLRFKESALRGPAELDFRYSAPRVSGVAGDASLTAEERKEEAAMAFERLLRHFGHAHFQVVAFDLRLPLEAQLHFAERGLNAAAKLGEERGDFKRVRARNFTPRSFPHYLRALDATASGATVVDIVTAILPGEDDSYPNRAASKKVAMWIRKGEELRDGGYRAIPLNAKGSRLPKDRAPARRGKGKR